MVVLGLGVSLVAAGLAAWVLAYALDGDIAEETSREAGDVRDRFEAELPVPGEVEVELSEGHHLVYAVVPADPAVEPEEAAAGLRAEVAPVEGEVIGPAEPDENASSTAVFQGSDTDFDLELVGEVDIPSDGTYTVAVDGAATDEVTAAGVVEAVPPHAGADAALRGGLLFVGGLLVGGLGALVALVGAVWLLIVRLAPRPEPAW
jgi:hypothetical protein